MNMDFVLGNLKKAEQVLGYDPATVEQASYEWHRMRLGVVTASKASAVVMKAGSATRQSYMAELCAEIATGAPMEMISGKAIDWGREYEPLAIQSWEFVNGEALQRFGFMYSEDMRLGCSPDALTSRGGWETKCPFITTNHILTLADGVIKPEYQWQIQFSLMVSGFDEWIFNSFDPRMKKNQLCSITCERNDKQQATLADAVPQFILELDRMLDAVGFTFGQPWEQQA